MLGRMAKRKASPKPFANRMQPSTTLADASLLDRRIVWATFDLGECSPLVPDRGVYSRTTRTAGVHAMPEAVSTRART